MSSICSDAVKGPRVYKSCRSHLTRYMNCVSFCSHTRRRDAAPVPFALPVGLAELLWFSFPSYIAKERNTSDSGD